MHLLLFLFSLFSFVAIIASKQLWALIDNARIVSTYSSSSSAPPISAVIAYLFSQNEQERGIERQCGTEEMAVKATKNVNVNEWAIYDTPSC